MKTYTQWDMDNEYARGWNDGAFESKKEKDSLSDIAFRITAYHKGKMTDAEYQASVLSILEEWQRKSDIVK